MGFRFRRSFKIFPGVRVNLSKTGPSLSVGARGATANFGHGRRRTTVGIPGTGLSWSKTESTASRGSSRTTQVGDGEGTSLSGSDGAAVGGSSTNVSPKVAIVVVSAIVAFGMWLGWQSSPPSPVSTPASRPQSPSISDKQLIDRSPVLLPDFQVPATKIVGRTRTAVRGLLGLPDREAGVPGTPGMHSDTFHLDHGFSLEVGYRRNIGVRMVLMGSAVTQDLEQARKWADLPKALPPAHLHNQAQSRQGQPGEWFRVNGRECKLALSGVSLTFAVGDGKSGEARSSSVATEGGQSVSSHEP
jgi:Protein of unknown function (DUF4236)